MCVSGRGVSVVPPPARCRPEAAGMGGRSRRGRRSNILPPPPAPLRRFKTNRHQNGAEVKEGEGGKGRRVASARALRGQVRGRDGGAGGVRVQGARGWVSLGAADSGGQALEGALDHPRGDSPRPPP